MASLHLHSNHTFHHTPTHTLPCCIHTTQLDPHNAVVLHGHLLCAAKELPLLPDSDGALFGATQLTAAVAALTQAGLLGRGPRDPVSLGGAAAATTQQAAALQGTPDPQQQPLHYTGPVQNPAADISLRTIDPERFIIYNSAEERVLEDIEANMAFYSLYDGAVYLYQVGVGVCRCMYVPTGGILWR